MQQIGYSLVNLADGSEIQFWGDNIGGMTSIPDMIRIPDVGDVWAAQVGFENGGYRLVARMWQEGAPDSVVFDGTQIIVTRAKPLVSVVSDIQFRLALNKSGLRASAEVYIANSSQDVKDWWDRSLRFEIGNPMILDAMAALSKTPDDLQQLFNLAATL